MTYYPHRIQTIVYLSLGVINIVVYILVFVASITKAIDGKLGEIIQAVYCCPFSVFLVFNELKAFSISDVYFGFLNVCQGKGLMMLFLGCLVMCENAFNIIVTIFGFTIGLAYVILSFIPCVSLPKDICYCFHQYRNQKNNDYHHYYQSHQRDVWAKHKPQLQEKQNYPHANQKQYNHISHIVSFDDEFQSALFTVKSPIHLSNGSTVSNVHY